LFTFFIDKSSLPPPVVQVGDCARFDVVVPVEGGFVDRQPVETPEVAVSTDPTVEVDLLSLAYARSGDKGDSSNIAIIARKPEYVPILRRELTPERIARHFAESVHGQVVRFEAPGLHAFNFLLFDALGGGGMASRRIDPQGKAYGQRALEMRIPVPKSVADALPENHRNHKNS
jgi:hypothetical protein